MYLSDRSSTVRLHHLYTLRPAMCSILPKATVLVWFNVFFINASRLLISCAFVMICFNSLCFTLHYQIFAFGYSHTLRSIFKPVILSITFKSDCVRRFWSWDVFSIFGFLTFTPSNSTLNPHIAIVRYVHGSPLNIPRCFARPATTKLSTDRTHQLSDNVKELDTKKI